MLVKIKVIQDAINRVSVCDPAQYVDFVNVNLIFFFDKVEASLDAGLNVNFFLLAWHVAGQFDGNL